MAASRRLRELQSQPCNKICVDCSQKNPQWASVSFGVFMCLECSGKHRGLGVHISFVRSVTMDSWSEVQLKKMELGGNDNFNKFLSQYGIPKETEIVSKYNTKAASIYRDKIQSLAEGKPWRDPPVVKASLKGGGANGKPPLSGGNGNRVGNFGGNSGWDSWGNDDDGAYDNSNNNNMRRNQSAGDFRSGGGSSRSPPARSKSTEDIHSRAQFEASAANKESFFARKMAENESKPDGIPPSQGGKYVGFGSSPAPVPRNASQGDVLSAVAQGFGRLSLVASSAAQSAAGVVQAGTREITSKVTDGGYDYKVNETVNVVTTKTTEIGQKTWGMMKGVMALASQKVEEYTKEGSGWSNDGWQPRNESERNGHYQEFGQESKGYNSSIGGQSSSNRQPNSVHSASWDDWDSESNRKEEPRKGTTTHNGDDWAGWDDKDDGFESFHQTGSDSKVVGYNGKSDAKWTGGGFV